MVDTKELERTADLYRALANPVRLQIVQMLLEGEKCQCDIHPNIPVSQSTVSSYLTQLVRSGILTSRKEGQKRLYQIANKKILKLIKLASEIVVPVE